jgi:hypothetical protein
MAQRNRKQSQSRSKLRLNRGMKIAVLADENPRRPRTRAHKVFGLYRTGMTLEKFYQRGKRLGAGPHDVRWDLQHGHIEVRRTAAH